MPSYPAVEAAVRALARVVEYAVWLRTPDGAETVDPADVDAGRRRSSSSRVLRSTREGGDLDHEQLTRAARRRTASTCGRACRSSTLDEALAAGRELGWDVVLKATADHLRQRPDLAHVWRNIDTADEMRDAWESSTR